MATIPFTAAIAGRKWTIGKTGTESVSVVYERVLNAPLAIGTEGTNLTGVPTVGSVHPTNNKLKVEHVDYDEGTGGEKKVVKATVVYTLQGEDDSVEAWGWDAGTEEKELVEAADSTENDRKPVVNSAGDPFQTVPKVTSYAPTFTKVVKFAERKAGAMAYNCKVNEGEMTIGGQKFDPATLLCSVAEERIFDDEKYNYRYRVTLKFKTNRVAAFGVGVTECGWDVALADAGMRELDTQDEAGKAKVLIRMRDGQTGRECVVQSPALLDGSGHKLSDTDPDQNARNLRFQAYQRATFPDWFYSEPPIEEPEEEADE